MAAELGQRMLEKNDDLQEQLEGLRQENLNIVQVRMGNNHKFLLYSSYSTVLQYFYKFTDNNLLWYGANHHAMGQHL